jgi:hypothetical protein
VNGSPEFKFYRRDADGWHLGRRYNTSPVYAWMPSVGDVGAHSLQVWVRSGGSLAVYEAVLTTTFDVAAPSPLTVAIAANPGYPAQAGHPIVFTGTTTGGAGPIEFKFFRRDADGWHLARDYGPDNRYEYTPGAGDVGDHVVQVWVRNRGSATAYENWAGTTFAVVVAPLANATLAVDTPFPVPAGTVTTWTMGATGGTPPLQYQFWVNRAATGWAMVRDYAVSNTVTWCRPRTTPTR